MRCVPGATRGLVRAVQLAAPARDKGVGRLVDAPISGGDVGAKQGTLSILVGASPKDFARPRPLSGPL